MNILRSIEAIFISFVICIMSACTKNASMDIEIIGDSIIDRWDVYADFPSMIIGKHGKGGAGMDFLESFAGKMKGKTVIVLIGTNDNRIWDENYVTAYVEYVGNLSASSVIVVSVLPRAANGDRETINEDIASLNEGLKAWSTQKGWTFVDAYPLFLEDDGHMNMNLYTDGLHLSNLGYDILGDLIKIELK